MYIFAGEPVTLTLNPSGAPSPTTEIVDPGGNTVAGTVANTSNTVTLSPTSTTIYTGIVAESVTTISLLGTPPVVFNQNAAAYCQLQITVYPATLLGEDAAGDLVAAYSSGVYRFQKTSGSWSQISPNQASSIAVSAGGNVIAEFIGAGVYSYNPFSGGWTQLAPYDAYQLGVDAEGNVAAEFPGSGVYYYNVTSASWTQLLYSDASLLAMDTEGTIIAVYSSGIYANPPSTSSWSQLAATVPLSIAASGNGLVAAGFTSGIFLFQNGSWSTLDTFSTYVASSIAVNSLGQVTAVFGSGVYLYNGTWTQISPYFAVAAAMNPGGGDLAASFPASGIYDETISSGNWVQETTYSVF
jgi:hypothetical protein